MKHLSSSAFVAVMVLSCSCHPDPARRSLDTAEELMWSEPDSSLVILESIDTSSLNTSKIKARYSLLYSMALDKNYIDTTDISIIEPALVFYGRKGCSRDKMLSLYYSGRIYFNRQEYAKAILQYTNARQYAENDNYYLGLIYGAIGDCYNASYNTGEEVANMKKSLDSFMLYGAPDHIELAKFKLAQAYDNNGDKDIADSLYRSLFCENDTTFIAVHAMSALVESDLKSDAPDCQEDLELLESLHKCRGFLFPDEWYEYAYLKYLTSDQAEAESIVQELEKEYGPDKSFTFWRYKVCLSQNRNSEALLLLQDMLTEQNRIVKDQLAQSVFKAQSSEYRLALELKEKQSTVMRQFFIIILSLCLLAITISIFIIRLLRERINTERDRFERARESSRQMFELAKKEFVDKENLKMQKLRKDYAVLFQKKYGLICQGCKGDSFSDPDKITIKAMKEYSGYIGEVLKEISGKTATQKEFEKRINDELDGIIFKIRNNFPNLSDEDIRLICYLIVGFDTSSISFLMGISKENVRVKKHRIKERLQKKECDDIDLCKAFL